MTYAFRPSPHKSSRRGCSISAIILHFTANATLAACVRWFQSPSSRVSAHYVVGRRGEVVQMVQESEKAWHAGLASLEGDTRVNSMSIGIEIVNWGELRKDEDGQFFCWPEATKGSGEYTRPYDIATYGSPVSGDGKWWAPYTQEQRDAVAKLCREIVARYPGVTRDRIVGHSDVAPGRKTDPGPAWGMEEARDRVFLVEESQTGDDSWYRGDNEDIQEK